MEFVMEKRVQNTYSDLPRLQFPGVGLRSHSTSEQSDQEQSECGSDREHQGGDDGEYGEE